MFYQSNYVYFISGFTGGQGQQIHPGMFLYYLSLYHNNKQTMNKKNQKQKQKQKATRILCKTWYVKYMHTHVRKVDI
jgi:hypothetical protein